MEGRKLYDVRTEFSVGYLSGVDDNLLKQFDDWYLEAVRAKCPEPNAMSLATATDDGKPSVRIVLLKDYGARGFTFFSNYNSKKGQQILQNPHGALLFFWPKLERQVRIEGQIERVDDAESDAYFHSRPRESRIGAWASAQSQVIPDREHIDGLTRDFAKQFEGKPITRPHHWGGFLLIPSLYEFWQGRPNRLHDRIQYTLTGGNWVIERLAP